MIYLLDTNICIYIIKKRPQIVLNRFRQMPVGEIGISSITLSELAYGVEKSQFPEKNLLALEMFTTALVILPYDSQAAGVYGKIRADLEKKGKLIGPIDIFIAAHALSEGLILVTNNEREFRRISDLKVENWVTSEH